jgi:hypothetical protein
VVPRLPNFAEFAHENRHLTFSTVQVGLDDALARVIRNSLFNPTQILVRTEVARAVGGCDERVLYSQEYGLSLRLAAAGPFVHVPETLAFQRVGIAGNLSADQGGQLARATPRARAFPCRQTRFAAVPATARRAPGGWARLAVATAAPRRDFSVSLVAAKARGVAAAARHGCLRSGLCRGDPAAAAMTPSPYDRRFYDLLTATADPSAAVVVPKLLALAPVASVVDVGCGTGGWIAAFLAAGIADTLGGGRALGG